MDIKIKMRVWLGAMVLLLAVSGCGRLAGDRSEEPMAVPDPITDAPPSPEPDTPPPAETEGPPDYAVAMRPAYVDDVAAFTDKTRYQMTLQLTDDPMHVDGQMQVIFVNDTGVDLEEVVFRLYPNVLSSRTLLLVSRAQVNGRSVQTRLEELASVLYVQLEAPLPPDESVTIDLDFTFDLPTDVEVGYGRISDISGIVSAPTFFPMLSAFEDGEWWTDFPDSQGDPGYSETALYQVTLSAPSYLTLATTGNVVDETPRPNGTTSYEIVTGPVRDFALAYSRDFTLLTDTRNDLTVNVWSAIADRASQEYALETAFATVDTFDVHFGGYPYSELDLVEAPVSALGIEYPGLVYLADRIWTEGDPIFEWVIVHEIAHQWWYGMVGNDQVDEPWLDEGLAEYSVEVYYREQVGPRAASQVRGRYAAEVENYVAVEGNSQLPVGLPASEYSGREYRVFVYSGGALIYGELVDQFGLNETRNYLQTYFRQFRYEIVHNEDVLALVEQVMGPEAGDLFEDWVIGGR